MLAFSLSLVILAINHVIYKIVMMTFGKASSEKKLKFKMDIVRERKNLIAK